MSLLTIVKTISTSTITFPAITEVQVKLFDEFLRTILWEDKLPGDASHKEFEIHRLKGRIPVIDGRLLLVQGVRNVYEMTEAKGKGKQGEDEPGQDEAKLVLIGRGVDQLAFRESLISTLGSP